VPSSCGAHYFLTLVDDASRAAWFYLMREKGEAGILLKGFISMAKTKLGKQVKVVRTHNGIEFKSGPMKSFYHEGGIMHQTSCVDTLQQNGKVERKH